MKAINHVPDERATVPATRLVLLSIVLWVVGVLAIRLAAPHGVFGRPYALPLLLATLPLVWLTLDLAGRVAGASARQDVAVVSWVSMPALLLDGAAFSLAPGLYGPGEAERVAGAAWLLWFVGASMALALWRGSRHPVFATDR